MPNQPTQQIDYATPHRKPLASCVIRTAFWVLLVLFFTVVLLVPIKIRKGHVFEETFYGILDYVQADRTPVGAPSAKYEVHWITLTATVVIVVLLWVGLVKLIKSIWRE